MAKLKKFKLKLDIDKEVTARPLNPEGDLHFIYNSWLTSYKTSDFARAIMNEVYYTHHHNLITSILTQVNNSVTVLCDPEDHSSILAYIVYNTKDPIVFYTYVKFNFRGMGLGRYLLEGVRKNFDKTEIQCTHKLNKWGKIAKPLELIYNPYLLKEYSNGDDTNSQD